MPVKIDMEIPESCVNCRLKKYNYGSGYVCCVEYIEIVDMMIRHECCPLIEVQDD